MEETCFFILLVCLIFRKLYHVQDTRKYVGLACLYRKMRGKMLSLWTALKKVNGDQKWEIKYQKHLNGQFTQK